VGTKFDAVLDNNGTLDDLYQQVMRLAQDPLVAK
jgi:dephospho-CoA kinase